MRVLVVEDDLLLVPILRDGLKLEGFAVDDAGNGVEALRLAKAIKFDAILLDLGLPGSLDGWEVLTSIRDGGSGTPIVVLTGTNDLASRVRALDNGADDYVTKPFELRELVARVKALIRRSANHPSPRYRIGDIEVDLSCRTVGCNGETVHLTAMEFSLLELLLLRRGRPVSREEIYRHLYDSREDTSSNVLDVFVSNLRRKLGKGLVQTRRGEGYVIPRGYPPPDS